MRKAVLAFAIFFLAVPFISAESYLDSQKLTGEGTLGISSEVYLDYEYDNKAYTGFSTDAPNPNNGTIVGWDGGLNNEYSGNNIILTTSTTDNTGVKGIFPAEPSDTLYIWFFSNRTLADVNFDDEYRKVTVSISRMTSPQYSKGLDWSLKLVKKNNKTWAFDAELDSGTVPSQVIYDGYGTRVMYDGFNSNDFEYWTIGIETDSLGEDVPAGASFSGTITIGVSGGL